MGPISPHGYIAKSMRYCYNNHCHNWPMNDYESKKLIILTMRAVFDYYKQQWEKWNQGIHGHDNESQWTAERLQLLHTVRSIYSLKEPPQTDSPASAPPTRRTLRNSSIERNANPINIIQLPVLNSSTLPSCPLMTPAMTIPNVPRLNSNLELCLVPARNAGIRVRQLDDCLSPLKSIHQMTLN